ncbi:tetraspanin [Holotrichia oblita]|uniref:Tetraspanin n=1 Tax=Holotrichia oblita TaxID=644536 RepID=A0ACB9T474_HOLOL|nr:tetraspanin [Holotrichia oblita]
MIASPVVLIVTGTVVFLIAFLGCFGAIRESHNMLIAFAVGLLVIFILELAVGIVAACYNGEFQDGLKSALRKSIDKYENVDADKQAWDNVQRKV